MKPEQRYNELREEVLKNLELMKEKIDKHQQAFESEPDNWGYVGDLSNWNDRLREIVNP